MRDGRPLVYGGGSQGIMGVVSGTVLADGGAVTGIVPYAIKISGGEGESNFVEDPRGVGQVSFLYVPSSLCNNNFVECSWKR